MDGLWLSDTHNLKILEDIDSFISAAFGERVSTPLYSTFSISWALWNWKIIFVTLILNADNVPWPHANKLQYVQSFINWCDGLIFPLISTAAFIFLFPYAANYTHKKSLEFKKKRMTDKAEIIDKDRSFTRKQVDEMLSGYTERAKNLETEVVSFQRQVKVANDALQSRVKDATEFKVVNAKYGLYDTWMDVTQDLTKPPKELFGFEVSNNSFTGGDPAPSKWKQLIIVYQNEQGLSSVVANEGDKVSYDEKTQSISVSSGPRTEKWKNSPSHREYTQDILIGTWKAEWIHPDKRTGSEEFRIDEQMRYLSLDGKHHYNIQDVVINPQKQTIQFTKVGVPPNRNRLPNNLAVQTTKLLAGTENTGSAYIDIKYVKLN